MRRAAQLAIAIAIALSGCGTLIDSTPTNRCTEAADCASGSCDTTLGMCVATPPTPMQVVMQLVPSSDPFGGTPLAFAFPAIEVSGQQTYPMTVPFGVPVFGRVRSAGGELVSAELTFTSLDDLPCGPGLSISTRTFPAPMIAAQDNMESNFATQVLPDRNYLLTIEPNGEWRSQLPILRQPFITTGGFRLEYQYPQELVQVQGVVVDSMAQPQNDLLVRAIDASGRIVSSTFITGSDLEHPPGYFMIRFAPGAQDQGWLLQFNATGSRATGDPVPIFTVDPATLIPDSRQWATVLMPDVPAVITYSGWVESVDEGGAHHAVPGATLTLTADDITDASTGVVGSYQTMAMTDANGMFEARVLPGNYSVLVTPADRELGVLRDVAHIEPPDGHPVMGQAFQVPARVRFGGFVQTPDGEHVAGVHAQATARGGDYGGMLGSAARYARSTDAVTDATGLLDLRLDVGVYDITIQPAATSGYPWIVQRDVPIGGTSFPLNRGPFELSAPVPLSGRATWPDGTAITSAEVRACAVVPSGDGVRTVPIAQATTDAEGRYNLLLPPSP